MSGVRTYNPSVRVGNWNEDIQLEEDMLKDFLGRRERGELLIQRSAKVRNTASRDIALSTFRDGNVRYGDIVMLTNPPPKDESRRETALAVAGMPGGASAVVATSTLKPTARTAFVITSIGGGPKGLTLKYSEPFYLCTIDEDDKKYLYSEKASFQKCAKKSRHNEVTVVATPSHCTEWRVEEFDPQFRLEMEHSDVKAHSKMVLVHQKTNQALCLEADHLVLTPFGKEYEISSFTNLDSHRAEKDTNHWVINMGNPRDPTPLDCAQPGSQ